MNKILLLTLTVTLQALILHSHVRAENIDPENINNQYLYGENIGWLNAEPNGDGGQGINVENLELTGYIWSESVGWISLSCKNTNSCARNYFAVKNDGAGKLSGYAWGENVGWINFSPTHGGVTINRDGVFIGWAWGENIGWITFTLPLGNYQALTSWEHHFLTPADQLFIININLLSGYQAWNERLDAMSQRIIENLTSIESDWDLIGFNEGKSTRVETDCIAQTAEDILVGPLEEVFGEVENCKKHSKEIQFGCIPLGAPPNAEFQAYFEHGFSDNPPTWWTFTPECFMANLTLYDSTFKYNEPSWGDQMGDVGLIAGNKRLEPVGSIMKREIGDRLYLGRASYNVIGQRYRIIATGQILPFFSTHTAPKNRDEYLGGVVVKVTYTLDERLKVYEDLYDALIEWRVPGDLTPVIVGDFNGDTDLHQGDSSQPGFANCFYEALAGKNFGGIENILIGRKIAGCFPDAIGEMEQVDFGQWDEFKNGRVTIGTVPGLFGMPDREITRRKYSDHRVTWAILRAPPIE